MVDKPKAWYGRQKKSKKLRREFISALAQLYRKPQSTGF